LTIYYIWGYAFTGVIRNLNTRVIRNLYRNGRYDVMNESVGLSNGKLGLSIVEACDFLGGISKPSLYRLVSSTPAIRTYKIGARRFIYRTDLEQYVEFILERA